MDDSEYQAAFDALDTIQQTLEKHWMRKPDDRGPLGERPDGASIEVEIEGAPADELEELSPPVDDVARETEPEPISVTEFMGPRKGPGPSAPPPSAPPPEKRGRGRPRKVR